MPTDNGVPRYREAHRREVGRSNNVLIEGMHNAKLMCGHSVTGYPVASLAGRGWYACPQCDSLVKEKAKSS